MLWLDSGDGLLEVVQHRMGKQANWQAFCVAARGLLGSRKLVFFHCHCFVCACIDQKTTLGIVSQGSFTLLSETRSLSDLGLT